MSQAALARARNLMRARPGSIVLLHALAVLDALVRVGIGVVAALLLALVASRGITHLTERHLQTGELTAQPGWIRSRLPDYDTAQGRFVQGPSRETWLADTGLYPVVADARFSPNPVRRWGGQVLGGLVQRLRPLRSNQSALNTLLIAGLILLLAAWALGSLRRARAAAAAGRAAWNLRNQVHRQAYRLGESALPTEGAGSVVPLFTDQIDQVRDGLQAELITTWYAPVLAAGLLVMALFLAPVQAVFLASLAGLVGLAALYLGRARRAEASTAAVESAGQLALLEEDLGLLRTVRVFSMEAVDRQRFESHLDGYQDAEARRLQAEARGGPSTLLLLGSAGLMAAGLLGSNVLQGRLSLATALSLVGTLAALAVPVYQWLRARAELARAAESAGTLDAFLERRPNLQMGVNARFLPPLRDRIRFENVAIEAADGRTLLADFSAEIPVRGRVALMGLDDEAKHAVACLVPRLVDPSRGRVTIDGVDLRDVTLDSLRAQVALVLQTDLVFTDTVLQNIGLGNESYTLPRIVEAAKLAHAHQFIQELPRGYETVIGAQGHPLSADQQYRIALARAVLHDPSVLILEEPTEPLDDAVKPLIDDTLERLAAQRTVLVLPHRLSTIRKCNQVIILHNGRVETAGAPRDLHAQSKLFRHLQYVEFNQFANGELEAGQMG